MNILVLGGTHGNERFGIDVHKSLASDPIEGVDTMIANPAASEQGIRFVDMQFQEAYGVASPDSDTYEARQAAAVLEISKRYDVTLDVHNGASTNYFVIRKDHENPKALRLAPFFGFNHVFVTEDRDNGMVPNGVLLEYASPEDDDEYEAYKKLVIPKIRSKLGHLARVRSFDDLTETEGLRYFTHAIGIQAGHPIENKLSDIKITEPFQRLPDEIVAELGLQPPAYANTWNYKNMSEGRYFGDILVDADKPAGS